MTYVVQGGLLVIVTVVGVSYSHCRQILWSGSYSSSHLGGVLGHLVCKRTAAVSFASTEEVILLLDHWKELVIAHDVSTRLGHQGDSMRDTGVSTVACLGWSAGVSSMLLSREVNMSDALVVEHIGLLEVL